MTWSEFTSQVAQNGIIVDVPENTVFDLDELYPTGVPTLSVRAEKINGNGLIIKHAYVKDKSFLNIVAGPVTINGINFVDCYIESITEDTKLISAYFNGYAYINDCTFSGAIFGAKNAYVIAEDKSNYTLYANRCSFNFFLTGKAEYKNVYVDCTDCWINLYGDTNDSYVFYKCKRCTFTSYKVYKSPTDYVLGTLTCTTTNAFSMATSVLCKIDLQLRSTIAQEQRFIYTVSGSKNLINKTKINISESGSEILCTEEQINDYDYLVSVGFPVGSDSA